MSCKECNKKKKGVSHKLLPYLTDKKKIDPIMEAWRIKYEITK